MEYVFARTNEVRQLERKLACEIEDLKKNIKSLHTTTLMRSLKRKLQLINWTLQLIELNPNIPIQEVEILVDCNIDGLESELGDAQSRWQGDRIYDEIRSLEWILFTMKILHSSMDRFIW